VATASHQSISAALRYIDSMLLDAFSDIVGTDLRRAGTSPFGRDSANTIVLTDASGSATMTLKGSDVHDDLDEDTLQPGRTTSVSARSASDGIAPSRVSKMQVF
jgi:hypothetical protein